VYLAEHRESHQKFAIKAIQKKKVKDYTTFINEINILKVLVSVEFSLLSSPCIVLGPPEHYQVARDLGMERRLFLGARVSHHNKDLFRRKHSNSLICFRYCEGGELFHFILQRKHLAEREAAMIMYQLLGALVYLHGQNISHRDIKPENFMLARKNDPTCVKMIDFGLSKDFSGQETMKTMSGSVSLVLSTSKSVSVSAVLHRTRGVPAEL